MKPEWRDRVTSLLESGDSAAALDLLDQVVTDDPGRTSAWLLKGKIHSQLGDNLQALSSIEGALAHDPEDADLWALKAGTLGLLHRPEESLRCCDKALAINAWNAGAWMNKAYAQHQLGQLQAALASFEQALRFGRGRYDREWEAIIWRAKTDVLLAADQAREALSCCEQAIALDPQQPEYRSTRERIRNRFNL